MSYQTGSTRQKSAASTGMATRPRSKEPSVAVRSSAGVPANTYTQAAGFRSRQAAIGLILVVALLSFEIFNFDTTRFALADLLGEVSFLGLRWATILAIAFCAIDFAGLAHLLTPQAAQGEQKGIWYLMGAWLLGATLNALMTWWAVSLTLLSHDFGNEVLSRDQLLQIVPVFVAVLVWLTRILFIGAFSVAGNQFFGLSTGRPASLRPVTHQTQRDSQTPTTVPLPEEDVPLTTYDLPDFLQVEPVIDEPESPKLVESTSYGPIGRSSLREIPLAAAAARGRRR